MSTIYETAFDTVRDTSERLAREIPTRLPSGLMPSGVDWSEDVVERVADELVHGFGVVKDAVGPVASVAVGAGANAAIAGSRTARRHPVVLIGGGIALVALVVWVVRRRRKASEQPTTVSGYASTEASRLASVV